MHTRLFTSLVILEPVIVPDTYSGYGPLLSLLSLKRRDTWPSRSAAIKSAKKAYKKWDPRVFERWVQNAYRELPTILYPGTDTQAAVSHDQNDPPVTLKSSKHQEVMQYIRPNFGAVKREASKRNETSDDLLHEIQVQPDVIGPLLRTTPFYRSEPAIAWKLLDHMRPSVLYVFGGRSPISTPYIRNGLVEMTGAGIGGSGGVKRSKVKQVILDRAGHMAPLEDVTGTAFAIAEWMGPVVQQWTQAEERVGEGWAKQTPRERLSVSAEWMPALESACKFFEKASKL